MKNFLWVSAFLAMSLSALANDHVGEFKKFKLVREDATTEIKQIFSSYDEDKDELTLSTFVTILGRGEVEVSKAALSADDAWSHEKAQQVLANCEKLEGKLENIEVAGAEMASCHFNTLDSEGKPSIDIWMGDVPLDGILKMDAEETGVLEVVAYRWNS